MTPTEKVPKRRPWRRAYRMSGPFNVANPKAQLISCTDGTTGYLRIETGAGEYVGSIDRQSLLALARVALERAK